MAVERAPVPKRLRVVAGRAEDLPSLDLGEAVQLYALTLQQSRQLKRVLDTLRRHILRTMESAEVSEVSTADLHAVRQLRRLPPRIDVARATSLLERLGRLGEAQQVTLDERKARTILSQLYAEGRIRQEDLPFTEPREVEVLLVRPAGGEPAESSLAEETAAAEVPQPERHAV